jgi:hypothetical protein
MDSVKIDVKEIEPGEGLWRRCLRGERADRTIDMNVWYNRTLTEKLFALPADVSPDEVGTARYYYGGVSLLLLDRDTRIFAVQFKHNPELTAYFHNASHIVTEIAHSAKTGYSRGIHIGVWYVTEFDLLTADERATALPGSDYHKRCMKIPDPTQWFGPSLPFTWRRLVCGLYVSERTVDDRYSFRVTWENPEDFAYTLK